MRFILILAAALLGGLETLGGVEITHSIWSLVVTGPLAVITAIVIGKIAADL